MNDPVKDFLDRNKKITNDDVPRIVDEELQKLGWGDNARLSLLGNLGRENSWNLDIIFRGHNDPKNNAYNQGLISWQKERQKDLQDFMQRNGGIYENNRLVPNEQNLRLMARFMDYEMNNSRDRRVTDWRKFNQRLKDGNISLAEASQYLDKYIAYAFTDETGKVWNTRNAEWGSENNRRWGERARQRGFGQGNRAAINDFLNRNGQQNAQTQPSVNAAAEFLDRNKLQPTQVNQQTNQPNYTEIVPSDTPLLDFQQNQPQTVQNGSGNVPSDTQVQNNTLIEQKRQELLNAKTPQEKQRLADEIIALENAQTAQTNPAFDFLDRDRTVQKPVNPMSPVKSAAAQTVAQDGQVPPPQEWKPMPPNGVQTLGGEFVSQTPTEPQPAPATQTQAAQQQQTQPSWVTGKTKPVTQITDKELQNAYRIYTDPRGEYRLPDTEELRQHFLTRFADIQKKKADGTYNAETDRIFTAEEQSAIADYGNRARQQETSQKARQTRQNLGAGTQTVARNTQNQQTVVRQPDFVTTGKLVVPRVDENGKQTFENPATFTYDKSNQNGLADGEYRLTDENGENYILSDGNFIAENANKVLEKVTITLPQRTSGTTAEVEIAKRTQAAQVADALSEKYNIPRQDIIDFYATVGFTDLATGKPLADERYFQNPQNKKFFEGNFDERLGGGAGDGTTDFVEITERDLSRIMAFSSQRAASKDIYEAAKQGNTTDTEYVADIKARVQAGWMTREEADKEIEAFNSFYNDEYEFFSKNLRAQGVTIDGKPITEEEIRRRAMEAATKTMQNLRRESGDGTFATLVKQRQEEADRFARLSKTEVAKEMVFEVARTIPQIISGVSKAIGGLSAGNPLSWENIFNRALSGNNFSLDRIRAEDSLLFKVGQGWEEIAGTIPSNPTARRSYWVTATSGISQVLVQAALAYASGGITLPSLVGLGQGFGEQQDLAIKEGATQNQQLFRGIVGAALAVPDIWLQSKWFKALSPNAQKEAARGLFTNLYKQLTEKVGAEQAKQLVRTSGAAFLFRMAQKGVNLGKNVDEFFTPATTLGKLTAAPVYETLQEAVLEGKGNKIAAKFINRQDLSWEEIARITEEDLHNAVGGFFGGLGGGVVQVSSEAWQKAQSRYENLRNSLAATNIIERQNKRFVQIGGKEYEITKELAPRIAEYNNLEKQIFNESKKLLNLAEKAKNKNLSEAEKTQIVAEANELRDKISELSEQSVEVGNEILEATGARAETGTTSNLTAGQTVLWNGKEVQVKNPNIVEFEGEQFITVSDNGKTEQVSLSEISPVQTKQDEQIQQSSALEDENVVVSNQPTQSWIKPEISAQLTDAENKLLNIFHSADDKLTWIELQQKSGLTDTEMATAPISLIEKGYLDTRIGDTLGETTYFPNASVFAEEPAPTQSDVQTPQIDEQVSPQVNKQKTEVAAKADVQAKAEKESPATKPNSIKGVKKVGEVSKVEAKPTNLYEISQMPFNKYLNTFQGEESEDAFGRKYRFDTTDERDVSFARGRHYFAVEKALENGKNVPAEVLADYPDLAEKYKDSAREQDGKKSASPTKPVRESKARNRALSEQAKKAAKTMFRPKEETQTEQTAKTAETESKAKETTFDTLEQKAINDVRDRQQKADYIRGFAQDGKVEFQVSNNRPFEFIEGRGDKLQVRYLDGKKETAVIPVSDTLFRDYNDNNQVDKRLSPTAYEQTRRKEASMTVKQKQARAKKVLARQLKNYDSLKNNWNKAVQIIELQKIADYAQEEGIELPSAYIALLLQQRTPVKEQKSGQSEKAENQNVPTSKAEKAKNVKEISLSKSAKDISAPTQKAEEVTQKDADIPKTADFPVQENPQKQETVRTRKRLSSSGTAGKVKAKIADRLPKTDSAKAEKAETVERKTDREIKLNRIWKQAKEEAEAPFTETENKVIQNAVKLLEKAKTRKEFQTAKSAFEKDLAEMEAKPLNERSSHKWRTLTRKLRVINEALSRYEAKSAAKQQKSDVRRTERETKRAIAEGVADRAITALNHFADNVPTFDGPARENLIKNILDVLSYNPTRYDIVDDKTLASMAHQALSPTDKAKVKLKTETAKPSKQAETRQEKDSEIITEFKKNPYGHILPAGSIVKFKNQEFVVVGSPDSSGFNVIPLDSDLAQRLMPFFERGASPQELIQAFPNGRQELELLQKYIRKDKLELVKQYRGETNQPTNQKPDSLKMVSPLSDWDSAAYIKRRDAIPLEKNGRGELLAPNGKVSNLQNETLWRTVRTKEFLDWFGSWQENAAIDSLLNQPSASGRGEMFSRVSSTISDSQILNPIVSLIPVDVMNDFGGKQGATQMLLHNPTMFVNIVSAANLDSDVITDMLANTKRIVAVTRTKLAETKPTPLSAEMFLALHALQNNLVAVGRRFSSLLSGRTDDKTFFNSLAFAPVGASDNTFSGNARVAIKRAVANFTNNSFARALKQALTLKGTTLPTSFDMSRSDIVFDTALSAFTFHKFNYSKDLDVLQPHKEASKVVDENGEPLVVWHASPVKGFEVFDKTKQNSKSVWGKGFYFTDIKEVADNYIKGWGENRTNKKGENREFFLNIRRLVDGDKITANQVIELLQNSNGKELNDQRITNGREPLTKEQWDRAKNDTINDIQSLQSDGWRAFNGYNALSIVRDFLSIKVIADGIVADFDASHNKGIKSREFIVFEPTQIKSIYNRGSFSEDEPSILKMVAGEKGIRNLAASDQKAISDGIDAEKRLANLEIAKEMEAAGKDAKTIWLATSWERGGDGKWKTEIDDGAFRLSKQFEQVWKTPFPFIYDEIRWRINKNGLYDVTLRRDGAKSVSKDFINLDNKRLAEIADFDQAVGTIIKNHKGKPSPDYDKNWNEVESFTHTGKGWIQGEVLKLPDVLENANVLFKAYPALKNVIVNFNDNLKSVGGQVSQENGYTFITLNPNAYFATPQSIVHHEVQHVIQRLEGFAQGGSPRQFKNDEKTYDLAKERGFLAKDFTDAEIQYKLYESLGGEVEARNVQTRLNMSPKERAEKTLAETEDVARESQIYILDAIGKAESVLKKTGDENNLSTKTLDELAPAVSSKQDDNLIILSPEAAEVVRSVEEALTDKPIPSFAGSMVSPVTSNVTPAELHDGLVEIAEALEEAGIDAATIDELINNVGTAIEASGDGIIKFVLEGNPKAVVHEIEHQQSERGVQDEPNKALATRYEIKGARRFIEEKTAEGDALRSAVGQWIKFEGRKWKVEKLTDAQLGHALEEVRTYLVTNETFGFSGEMADKLTLRLNILYAQARQREAKAVGKKAPSIREALKTFDIAESGRYIEKTEKYYEEANRSGQTEGGGVNTADSRRKDDAGNAGNNSPRANQERQTQSSRTSETSEVGQTKLRSLPETLREAGLDADDARYAVFSNDAAVTEAREKLSELGVEESLKYLNNSDKWSKRDAVMAFQIQAVLRDEAAKTDNPALAKQLREKAKELASRHAELATEAGQFTQAAAIVSQSVDGVIFHAHKIANKKGKPLSIEQVQKFEQAGSVAEENLLEITTLRLENQKLKNKLKALESGKRDKIYTERINRNAITRAKNKLPADLTALAEQIKKSLKGEPLFMVAIKADRTPVLRMVKKTPDNLTLYGAALLIDKPLSQINRDKFNAEMLRTFGKQIKSDLPQIFANAFNLRQDLLNEAKRDIQIDKLKIEFPQMSEEEIESKYKESETDKETRRKAGYQAKRLAAIYRPPVAKQKQDVLEIAEEIADDSDVFDYAVRIVTRETKTQDLERQNKDIYRKAKRLLLDAEARYKAEQERIKEEIAGTKNRLRELEREEFLKRRELTENQKQLSNLYRRLEEGAVKYYAKEGLKILGETRSMMASGDLSAPLRQGFYFSVTDTGTMFSKLKDESGEELLSSAYGAMYQSFTQAKADDAIIAIEHHPDFDIMLKMGIDFAEAGKTSFSLTKGEEAVRTEYAKKLPLLKHLLNFSERTFAGFLDYQRALIAHQIIQELYSRGATFKTHENEFKAAGKLINIATGRGHIRDNARIAGFIETFGSAFFAPRYMISRFQLLAHVTGIDFITMPPMMRRIALKKVARFHTITTLPFMALIALGLMAIDPDDDDFLKIRLGEKARYELLGGMQPPLRAIARMAKSAFLWAMGDKKDADFAYSMVSIPSRFLRGKLAPVPSLIVDYTQRKNFIGEPFTWKSATVSRIIPLSLRETVDAYMEDGVYGSMFIVPSFLGIGTSYYKDKEKKNEKKNEKKSVFEKVNRMSTDSLVEYYQNNKENLSSLQKSDLEKMLRNKADNASKRDTLTDDELEKVRTVLPGYQPAEKKESKPRKTPVKPTYDSLR